MTGVQTCALPISGSNKVWTSDITYIRTREGLLYLSVFMDLYSRSIVGWSMNNRLSEDLVIKALKKALWSRRPDRKRDV